MYNNGLGNAHPTLRWNMGFCGSDILWTFEQLINIVAYRPVAKQRLCKQRQFLGRFSINTFPLLGSILLIMQQLDYNSGNGVFLRGPCRDVISKGTKSVQFDPCGGRVEYLHRDPASRRRRRKGKSQI
jgi:hypothetical protein